MSVVSSGRSKLKRCVTVSVSDFIQCERFQFSMSDFNLSDVRNSLPLSASKSFSNATVYRIVVEWVLKVGWIIV